MMQESVIAKQQVKTKVSILTTGVFTLLLLVMMFVLPTKSFAQTGLDAIFAKVNNDIITERDFQQAYNDAVAELRARKIAIPSEAQMTRQVANNLINERLQLQIADQIGVVATPDEINATITDIARLNGLSVPELMKLVEGQNISVNRFRARIERQVRVRKLAQTQFYSSVRVSDQEIDNFIKLQNKEKFIYDFRVYAIVIPFGDAVQPKEVALDRAKVALKKAQAGDEFKSLVAEYSVAQNAYSGGDLGFLNGSALPAAYFTALQNIQEGDVTSIIEDNGAFHILKLAEIRSPYDNANRFLNEYRMSQLVISADGLATGNPMSDELLQLEVAKIVGKISAGESFEKLARIYSADKNTRSKSGDLGWIPETDFDDLMAQLVSSLQIGQISQPIPIAGRYHIFKLVDHRESTDFSGLERSEAEEILRRQKAEQEYALWIQRLRKDSTIEVM